jgi:hypothetical protein
MMACATRGAPAEPAAEGAREADPGESSGPALPGAWRYTVRASPDLERLDVRLCFEGASAQRLVPGESWAYAYLKEPRRVGPRGSSPLRVTQQGIQLPVRSGPGGCLEYGVEVGAAAREHDDRAVASRIGEDLALSPDLYLWRPARYAAGPKVSARFELPEGTRVSVPWPREGEGFVVPRSTFVRRGYTIIGSFVPETIAVPGGALHAVFLGAPGPERRALLTRWLAEAGRSVATLYGRFPRAHTQVVVSPVPHGSGVSFGWVVRGGGPSVNLLVGEGADEAGLIGEWVAIHEMSHLAVPFIRYGEPWLSEGIATYYQNVLRARAGLMSEEEAWEKLLDGFERGRISLTGRSLAEDSARMRQDGAYWRVYWAGTAIALLADVRLRRSDPEPRSLDVALEGLGDCCLGGEESFDAMALCTLLDEKAGDPALGQIAAKERGQTRFPEVEPVLKSLGVTDARGRLSLDDKAPLAHIRRAIMSPR